ncbi:MAG: PP2C family protein-serine/threonine phosphatase [Desulfobacterales bacterium]|jgi:serine phosphatase RsbU (regulator of sigma subunit)
MASVNIKNGNNILGTGELTSGLNKVIKIIDFWIERLSKAGSLKTDSEEQRLHKAVLIFLAVIYTVAGIIWGSGYLLLGLPVSGSIPLSYAFISATSLLYFFKTKHFKFFCRSQLTLILVLPFLLQWSLGGFIASGAVVLWSILSPIGALMFAGTTRSIPWFIAYVLLMVISGFQSGGGSWQQGTLSNTLVVASFVMNIGGVSAIVFILLRYFVHAREQAMAALDKEHQRVRHSLSLAMEVQQNLLPKANPQIDGLDIAGKSIYCDETGGDYYDFLEVGSPGEGKIGVVVGDVSDHGIPSALLMATARALIRQRCSAFGQIDQVVSDVNRQLAKDVQDSGRFMTLFYAEIERLNKTIRWVNAGHEPAMIFDPVKETFKDLDGGNNLALGVFEDTEFKEAHQEVAPGQIIVVATDGIWEVRNPEGEMFSKDRIRKIIRRNATRTANDIQNAILDSLQRFQKDVKLEDDMTLVVIKITS